MKRKYKPSLETRKFNNKMALITAEAREIPNVKPAPKVKSELILSQPYCSLLIN